MIESSTRNVELYMAVSLDGFIARQDGREDYLSTDNWKLFKQLAERAGAFVVGRKTYEAVREWDNHSYKNIEATRFVLTSDPEYNLPSSYISIQNPSEAVSMMTSDESDGLIVTGGSRTNRSFFDAGLVDFVTLSVEPKLIGEGKNILDKKVDVDLKFLRCAVWYEDLLRVRYKVID